MLDGGAMALMKLTAKQALFAEEYLKDLNATQAAKRAGYSAKTSGWIGQQLLAKSHIAQAVAERLQARTERTQIDADAVLMRLAALADADLADLYGPEGGLLPAAQWPEVWRKGLVAGVDVAEETRDGKVVGVVRKVRLADRVKVLELLGRHVTVGAWRDRMEVEVNATLAERLARARARGG